VNKLDLIAALAEKEGLKDKGAFDIVNTIFDGFTNTPKSFQPLGGKPLEALPGFVRNIILIPA
jgi:hypothetical protein